MNAGPLAERPVTVSMCFSSSSRTFPSGSKISVASATSASDAWLPFESTVMPFPMRQGVFGMARRTGVASPKWPSMKPVLTPAAIEITRGRFFRRPRIDSTAFATSFGFTHRRTMSASAAASAFAVVHGKPSSSGDLFGARLRARGRAQGLGLDLPGPQEARGDAPAHGPRSDDGDLLLREHVRTPSVARPVYGVARRRQRRTRSGAGSSESETDGPEEEKRRIFCE